MVFYVVTSVIAYPSDQCDAIERFCPLINCGYAGRFVPRAAGPGNCCGRCVVRSLCPPPTVNPAAISCLSTDYCNGYVISRGEDGYRTSRPFGGETDLLDTARTELRFLMSSKRLSVV